MIVIDNSELIRGYRKNIEDMDFFYGHVKESERKGEKLEGAVRSVCAMAFRDALKVPYHIRDQIENGASQKLREMIEKGYLELKREELCPVDPATKNTYWKNFFNDIVDRITANP